MKAIEAESHSWPMFFGYADHGYSVHSVGKCFCWRVTWPSEVLLVDLSSSEPNCTTLVKTRQWTGWESWDQVNCSSHERCNGLLPRRAQSPPWPHRVPNLALSVRPSSVFPSLISCRNTSLSMYLILMYGNRSGAKLQPWIIHVV